MIRLAIVLGGVGILMLTACSPNEVVETSDSRSTRQAQETAQVETAVFAGTQAATLVAIQATVDSAPIVGTQLAQLQQENLNLQATINAATTLGLPVQPLRTPTLTLNASPIAGTTTLGAVSDGRYSDLRTATDVDSSGCAVDRFGRFSPSIGRIYLTAVGTDVKSGTRHQVEWYFGEALRSTSPEWVADQDYSQICVYFWLSPSDTPFDSGLWKANLRIDGNFYQEVPFEICQAGEFC